MSEQTPQPIDLSTLTGDPQQANDPKTFDLADWLTGGTTHRRRESVTLYRNADLAGRIADLEQRIKTAEKESDMDSLGDTGTRSLEAEKEQLLQELTAAAAKVEVFALIDPEIKAVEASLGEKPEDYNYGEDIHYWYAVLAEAGTLEGQRLTAEQWRKIHETVGNQFRQVIAAYIASQRPDISPAFRR